jgi:hypothetical protein
MATNALLRVDQIDIESAIFAFGSVCLECIERAARTTISLWYVWVYRVRTMFSRFFVYTDIQTCRISSQYQDVRYKAAHKQHRD